MNFDEFQADVTHTVDTMSADVLIVMIQRLQQAIEQGKEPDQDVDNYVKLIEIYTHLKLYTHRLNKKIESYGGAVAAFPHESFNSWHREREKCQFAIHDLNKYKLHLRDKLFNKGIAYKEYHPHIHTLKPEKLVNVLRFAPHNALT